MRISLIMMDLKLKVMIFSSSSHYLKTKDNILANYMESSKLSTKRYVDWKRSCQKSIQRIMMSRQSH